MRFSFRLLGLLAVGALVSCGGMGFGLHADQALDEGPAPLMEPIEGQTFLIDFADVQHTVPSGLANLSSIFGGKGLLLHVVAEADEHLDMVVALSDEAGNQNGCETVQALPSSNWTNPSFETAPVSTELSVGGEPVSVESFELEGMFADEGYCVEGLRLAGVFDVRDLGASAFGDGEACALVEQLNGTCLPCDDGQYSCVEIELNASYAERVDIPFEPLLDTSGC